MKMGIRLRPKIILLPIVNRLIPIVADDYVDIEFGTGCVKITPAHDFNDYEVGKRHNLPMYNILTFDATIRSSAEVVNTESQPGTTKRVRSMLAEPKYALNISLMTPRVYVKTTTLCKRVVLLTSH